MSLIKLGPATKFFKQHNSRFLILSCCFLLTGIAISFLLMGHPFVAFLIVAGGALLMLMIYTPFNHIFLFALIALCAIPPTRMEESVLEYYLGAVVNDPIVTVAYYLIPGMQNYYPEIVLLFLILLLWTEFGIKSFQTIKESKLFSTSLILFVTLAMINCMIALSSGVDFQRWVREYIPIFVLLSFFPMFLWFRNNERMLKLSLHVIIILCLIYALHSVYTFFVSGIDIRLRLTHITPYNNYPFAGIAVVSIVPLLMLKRLDSFLRVSLWMLLAMAFGVILLNQIRGLVISVGISFAFIIAASIRVNSSQRNPYIFNRCLKVFIPISLILIILFAFVGQELTGRLLLGFGEESAQWRLFEIEAAWEKFIERPLYGWGLGSPLAVQGFGFGVQWFYIHNSFFYYLANLGVIGFVPWVILWVAILRKLLQGLNKVPDRFLAYFLSFGSILILIMTYGIFESTFRTYQNSIIMIISLAGIHVCVFEKAFSQSQGEILGN